MSRNSRRIWNFTRKSIVAEWTWHRSTNSCKRLVRIRKNNIAASQWSRMASRCMKNLNIRRRSCYLERTPPRAHRRFKHNFKRTIRIWRLRFAWVHRCPLKESSSALRPSTQKLENIFSLVRGWLPVKENQSEYKATQNIVTVKQMWAHSNWRMRDTMKKGICRRQSKP